MIEDVKSKVEVVLGKYQRQIFTTPGLVAHWSMDEMSGTTAIDRSGLGRTGTYQAGVSFGSTNDNVIAGFEDGYVARSTVGPILTTPNHASLSLSTSLSMEFVLYIPTGAGYAQYLMAKGTAGHVAANYHLYHFGTSAGSQAGQIQLFASAGGSWQGITSPTSVPSGWFHLVVTYDTVGGAKVYINGVLTTDVAAVGALAVNSDAFSINIHESGGISEAALYNLALTPAQVLAHYRATIWNDITPDVVAGTLGLRYGINNDGPTDCTASTGELHFSLRNDVNNSGGIQGWYSPASGYKRVGWDFGIPVRVSFTSVSAGLTNKMRFYGKVRVILPISGKWRERQVEVVAYDILRDLAESDARQVTMQIGKSETQLLDALLAVLPLESKPRATNFDAGVDVFPIAFDDLKGSAKVASVMNDIVQSSIGILVSNGDGTLRYRSRQSLSIGASLLLIDKTAEITVPSSLDKIYNRVRVTMHPKVISPTANEVLYTLPASSTNAIQLAPLANIELWTAYTDPNDRQTKVGGINIVTPVNNVHYIGNLAADGSGANASSSLTATLYPFSSTGKWSITNTSSSLTVFLTGLQVVGKAVRDPGPQTLESVAPFAPVDRPVNLDLPYQNDPYVGQGFADYTISLYSKLPTQVQSVMFMANIAPEFLTAALTYEPGDRVTVSEQITAVSAVMCHIRSVELEVLEHNIINCTFGLKPASVTGVWALGIVGSSELGVTSILGI